MICPFCVQIIGIVDVLNLRLKHNAKKKEEEFKKWGQPRTSQMLL